MDIGVILILIVAYFLLSGKSVTDITKTVKLPKVSGVKLPNASGMKLFNNIPRDQLVALAVASLVVLGALLYFLRDCACKKMKQFRARINNSNEHFSNSKPVFRMYYATWCGHCKVCKPEFKKLMDKNPSNVTLEMINEATNKEMIEQEGIEGYPTLILYKDGKKITYEGERTLAGFEEFLKDKL